MLEGDPSVAPNQALCLMVSGLSSVAGMSPLNSLKTDKMKQKGEYKDAEGMKPRPLEMLVGQGPTACHGWATSRGKAGWPAPASLHTGLLQAPCDE